jgi:hypothetical protein
VRICHHSGVRRHLAWVSTVPLMVAGLLAGHTVAYRLAFPDAHARADALTHSGHGYLGHAPLLLAVCLGVLLAALLFRAIAGFRGDQARPSVSRALILLPPAAFVVQEHVERLVHSGEIPWTASIQPSFLLGLALQLPFALAALLIAWALESFAHAVGCALAAPELRPRFPVFAPRPAYVAATPRPGGLARGYGERAPPLLGRT